jgi:hypothetical protein
MDRCFVFMCVPWLNSGGRDQETKSKRTLFLSRANQEDKEGARPPAFAASTIAVR